MKIEKIEGEIEGENKEKVERESRERNGEKILLETSKWQKLEKVKIK